MATTKTTSKDKGAARTYAALTRIEHNGDVYESGEEIELPDSDAEPLLTIGAIRPAQWAQMQPAQAKP